MSPKTSTPRRHVRVDYRVREDVDLGEVKREIARFVDAIRADSADYEYTSYQDVKDDRHFVHFGDFASDAVAGLQARPFFGHFTTFLGGCCRVGPEATLLTMVATARTSA